MQGIKSFQFRWLASLPLLLVTLLLIVIAVNALMGAHAPHAPMREALFDYYQRLAPAPATANSSFHVVLIDEESLEKVGPWPWPRTLIADLVDQTTEAGAKAVLIAEPLDVPDLLSSETIGDFWLQGAQDEALASQLKLLPRTDEVLARSLSALPAGVGFAEDNFNTLGEVTFLRSDITKSDGLMKLVNPNSDFLALPSARARYPLSPALSAASNPVVLNLPTDQNGLLRRTYLYWSQGEKPRPSLSLEAARLSLDQPHINLGTHTTATSSQGKMPNKITLGDRAIDLESTGTLRLYPPRRSSITTTSAWKVLEGNASRQSFLGSVILIGRSAATGDTLRTPRGSLAPVEIHAIMADQITNGVSLKRPALFGYIEAIAVMLLGAAAIMLAQRLIFWQAMAVATGGAILLMLLSSMLFFTNGWLINPLLPALAMFVGTFSIAGGKSVGTVLFDDNVRGAFRGMLPENAMKALREDRTQKILTGVQRKITVLACELRLTDDDLQSLSETPNNVSQIMAAASHHLRNTITKIGGTVDQAEGGRIFAYFNVPLETADHIEKACAAALAMIESMDKTNTELASSARTRNIQIHLAIGIATGDCFSGPMGHGRRNRYSAIGHAVDLASFLRRQSEYYGPAIICADHVHRESHHKYAFLELDRVETGLNEKPFNIHALIGNPFIKSSKNFRDLDTAHRALIQAYRAGNVQEARSSLEKVRQFPASNISLFDIYEERIKTLEEKEIPTDWDGTHKAAF